MLSPTGREEGDSTAPYRPGESVLSPTGREEEGQCCSLKAGRRMNRVAPYRQGGRGAMLSPRGREDEQCCPRKAGRMRERAAPATGQEER